MTPNPLLDKQFAWMAPAAIVLAIVALGLAAGWLSLWLRRRKQRSGVDVATSASFRWALVTGAAMYGALAAFIVGLLYRDTQDVVSWIMLAGLVGMIGGTVMVLRSSHRADEYRRFDGRAHRAMPDDPD